jgi:hypothetical protein
MKWRLTAVVLSAITITAFAGAISGTLAWYAYATQASVSYGGTSVYSTAQLQIGLKTDIKTLLLDEKTLATEYTLTTSDQGVKDYTINANADETYSEVIMMEDEIYWFTKPGTGLSEENISKYLKAVDPTHLMQGDSTTLIPCTTRAYQDGDDFKLYQNPSKLEYEHGMATNNSYSKIDFAFRVITSDGKTAKNQNVWLMDADESVKGQAGSALRLYFEDGKDNSVLLNPTSKEDGYTTTAGLLDLDNDGYYDYEITDYLNNTGKEYIYGLKDTEQRNPTTTFDSDDFDNINGVDGIDDTSDRSSFYAKHKTGNKGWTDYSGFELPKAYYKGTDSVYPDDSNGKLEGGKALTTTSDDEYGIADLSMTIYMEGWDHSVIDYNIDYTFQLGLTFQINKVE